MCKEASAFTSIWGTPPNPWPARSLGPKLEHMVQHIMVYMVRCKIQNWNFPGEISPSCGVQVGVWLGSTSCELHSTTGGWGQKEAPLEKREALSSRAGSFNCFSVPVVKAREDQKGRRNPPPPPIFVLCPLSPNSSSLSSSLMPEVLSQSLPLQRKKRRSFQDPDTFQGHTESKSEAKHKLA